MGGPSWTRILAGRASRRCRGHERKAPSTTAGTMHEFAFAAIMAKPACGVPIRPSGVRVASGNISTTSPERRSSIACAAAPHGKSIQGADEQSEQWISKKRLAGHEVDWPRQSDCEKNRVEKALVVGGEQYTAGSRQMPATVQTVVEDHQAKHLTDVLEEAIQHSCSVAP